MGLCPNGLKLDSKKKKKKRCPFIVDKNWKGVYNANGIGIDGSCIG